MVEGIDKKPETLQLFSGQMIDVMSKLLSSGEGIDEKPGISQLLPGRMIVDSSNCSC
jgi:hypothetical protein